MLKMAFRIAAVAPAVVAATAAFAAVELQPGQWQEIETGTENGKPAKTETTTSCMSADEAKDPLKGMVFDKQAKDACKTLEAKRTGGGISFRMQCKGEGFDMDIAAEMTFHTPQSYTGVIKSSVKMGATTVVSDKKVEAKRIGECKK